MQYWQGWPIERFLYLFLGAAFLLVWIQVALFHWKGGFRSKAMWGPVLYTPLLVLAAFAMVITPQAATAFLVITIVGIVEGLIGTVMHLRGISKMVGGMTLRNFIAGPPAILPVVYTALCAAAVIIYYWNSSGTIVAQQ